MPETQLLLHIFYITLLNIKMCQLPQRIKEQRLKSMFSLHISVFILHANNILFEESSLHHFPQLHIVGVRDNVITVSEIIRICR